METNKLEIKCLNIQVPELLSNVILQGDVSYKTFQYIEQFEYDGTQTSNIIYTFVNFVIEMYLCDEPVECIVDDYEIHLDRSNVSKVTTDMVDLYRIDKTGKRLSKIAPPKIVKDTYCVEDNINFNIKVRAYTTNVDPTNKHIKDNQIYYKEAFSSYLQLFNDCAHFNDETVQRFTVSSPNSHKKIIQVLRYVVKYCTDWYKDFDLQDHIVTPPNIFNSETFHYIKAVADITNDKYQICNVIKNTIQTRNHASIKYDVDILLKEFAVFDKILEKVFKAL